MSVVQVKFMGKKVDESDGLVLLKKTNGEKYYVFHPTLFKLYPKSGDMRKMNIKEIALHLVRLIHGYKIYVLTDMDDTVKGFRLLHLNIEYIEA